MILLDVVDVKKRFGPEPVLQGVTFELRPGDRIGLVGPNGCGKTTLLKILAERDEQDSGECRRHPTTHVGYLEQQPSFEPGWTLLDEARGALAGLVALEQEAVETAEAMAEAIDPAEQRRLAARYDHLQHELHSKDAYNIEHRIERILDGLRFRRESFDQPVASLSGGEQNRLMLAKLLLAEPNVMILDEPSNHLDIDATEWLEEFLVESSAAMIVVSHDRYFLDRVTTRTLELFDGTVADYTGNFSAYWRQKAERLLVERRTYEKQQEEIEKTKDFIRRNAYGQKHAQAEDRRKKLERIEPVARPREIAEPPMSFSAASRSGDIVVRAERLSKSYERTLFDDLNVDIVRGQRWALLGPNGCGKTTLLRCLLGLVEPNAGRIHLGQGVEVGYFDQQLAGLADDASVVDAIRPKQQFALNEQQRRGLLARFGLTGDAALQTVGSLSGGQRCRAALARLAGDEANFLVLDEPTNHLDLWARDALEKALKNFDGTVLLVSHDRYFVNRVVDHLLIIEPDRVRTIEGNYDTYQMMTGRTRPGAVGDAPAGNQRRGATGNRAGKDKKTASTPPSPKDKGKNKGKGKDKENAAAAASPTRPKPSKTQKNAKKRRFPYRKVSDIEQDVARHEATVQRLQTELLDPEVLRDGQRVRSIKALIEAEQSTLQDLYWHWEEAAEMNW